MEILRSLKVEKRQRIPLNSRVRRWVRLRYVSRLIIKRWLRTENRLLVIPLKWCLLEIPLPMASLTARAIQKVVDIARISGKPLPLKDIALILSDLKWTGLYPSIGIMKAIEDGRSKELRIQCAINWFVKRQMSFFYSLEQMILIEI